MPSLRIPAAGRKLADTVPDPEPAERILRTAAAAVARHNLTAAVERNLHTLPAAAALELVEDVLHTPPVQTTAGRAAEEVTYTSPD